MFMNFWKGGGRINHREDKHLHICLKIELDILYVLCFQAELAVWSASAKPLQRPYGLQPAGLFCPWDYPGKNTRVCRHALLQGIFPTQGSNPRFFHLLHWQVGPLPLAPPGKQCGVANWLIFTMHFRFVPYW